MFLAPENTIEDTNFVRFFAGQKFENLDQQQKYTTLDRHRCLNLLCIFSKQFVT